MARNEFFFALASFFLFIHGLTGQTPPTELTEITIAQGLKDGQILLSPHEIYALGFFSPRRSTNRYLGIWYKTINDTVVWVANRDSPITDSTGVLTLSAKGALHLKDGAGKEYWFTSSQSTKDPKAFLHDTGNLVINDTTSQIQLWQSFDQPCDTLLPGMKMGWDSAFSHERYIQSWKDETDPAEGDYKRKLDRTRISELVLLFNDTVLKYRSGPWDGKRWNGMPELEQLDSLQFHVQSDNYQKLYWYESDSIYNFWRLVVGSDGITRRTHNSSAEWKLYWYVPNDACDNYAYCGPHGKCSSNACECLDGFMPTNKSLWDIRGFSDGCRRIKPLEYNKNDRFHKFSNVKLPDTFNATSYPNNKNLDDCKNLCSTNSSCMAYTVMGLNGCVIWVGDLTDVVQFLTGGDDLYVRLDFTSVSDPVSVPVPIPSRKSQGVMIIAIVVPTIVVSLLLFVFGIWFWRKKQSRTEPFTSGSTPSNNIKEDVQIFEFNTLRAATDDFNESKKLGAGQFGPVFKGVLRNGDEIAVKRLSRSSDQGIEQLKNEVNLLAKLRHINLVKLLGFCIQQEEMLLCYEYLPNGSLDQLLFEDTSSQLDWEKRYKIIEAISWGLLYLHEENGSTIIHRDIKPSNILLDKNMVPKISDFGLAKLFDQDRSFIKVSTIAGTRGYIAPEVQLHGMLSSKSDVYSFGVLILETITGRKHSSFASGLVTHVLKFWNEGRILELADPRLRDTCPLEELSRCIHIALLCLLEQPEMRPKMRNINIMLSSNSSILPDLPSLYSFWGLPAIEASQSWSASV